MAAPTVCRRLGREAAGPGNNFCPLDGGRGFQQTAYDPRRGAAEFVRPANLDSSKYHPRTIDVELTGSRERLDNMRLSDLVATVDISDNPAGERIVRLNNERVHMDLPDGVKIESFKPTTIPIRLEPNLERQLPVDIKVEAGRPPALS